MTQRLNLRQLSLADDQEILFQRSDPSMNQYIDNPPCASVAEAREWIDKINRFITNNESVFWGICLKGESKLAGGICLWNIDTASDKAEIGFCMYPQHQGKGLMSEALQTVLQYGFEKMGLRRVEAYTHPENKASIAVLAKHDFQLMAQQPQDSSYIVFELKRD